jgi:hypothetical protein
MMGDVSFRSKAAHGRTVSTVDPPVISFPKSHQPLPLSLSQHLSARFQLALTVFAGSCHNWNFQSYIIS